jgi:type I restriction enzyme M protein
MWQALRNRQIANAKFRRQHPVGPYILDFYCHEHELAIELDGSQHFTDEGKAKDQARTKALHEKGITVLRFDNHQVLTETEAVLMRIYEELTPTPNPHPSPLPQGEGVYKDVPGFCRAATLEDIQANDCVLTPGRYVGAAPLEDDGIPFEEKMAGLSKTLYQQMEESEKLDAAIRENLEGLGYGE